MQSVLLATCLSVSPAAAAAPSRDRWQQGGPLPVRRLLAAQAGHAAPRLGASVQRGQLAAQALLVVVLAREALWMDEIWLVS